MSVPQEMGVEVTGREGMLSPEGKGTQVRRVGIQQDPGVRELVLVYLDVKGMQVLDSPGPAVREMTLEPTAGPLVSLAYSFPILVSYGEKGWKLGYGLEPGVGSSVWVWS